MDHNNNETIQLRAQLKMIQDQFNQIIGEQKEEINQQKIKIKRLEQESKGLQYENDILQRTITTSKNTTQRVKQLEDQLKQLQSTHEREKEYWIRDQQEQINRLKLVHDQTRLLLEDRIQQQYKEYEELVKRDQIKSAELQDLKQQALEYSSIRQINDELQKTKRQLVEQQYETQQQALAFEEIKQELQKKLSNERSKSQNSIKAAQETKMEFEKKYSQLMDQIIKNSQRKSISIPKQASSPNNFQLQQIPSFPANPSNLDQTMPQNDISQYSQNQSNHIRLSAINKALSDSIDDYDKSLLMSASCSKRKISKSELESRRNQQLPPAELTKDLIGSPKINRRSKVQASQQFVSPKNRKQSAHTIKCVKQYTFNLCEFNQEPDPPIINRSVKSRSSYNTNNNTNNSNNNSKTFIKSKKSKPEKENNLYIPEENQNINVVHSNKQFQLLENKEERLNTNTRFNSLLKIL